MSTKNQKPSIFFYGIIAMFKAFHFDQFMDVVLCQIRHVKEFSSSDSHVPVDTLGDQDNLSHGLFRESPFEIVYGNQTPPWGEMVKSEKQADRDSDSQTNGNTPETEQDQPYQTPLATGMLRHLGTTLYSVSSDTAPLSGFHRDCYHRYPLVSIVPAS